MYWRIKRLTFPHLYIYLLPCVWPPCLPRWQRPCCSSPPEAPLSRLPAVAWRWHHRCSHCCSNTHRVQWSGTRKTLEMIDREFVNMWRQIMKQSWTWCAFVYHACWKVWHISSLSQHHTHLAVWFSLFSLMKEDRVRSYWYAVNISAALMETRSEPSTSKREKFQGSDKGGHFIPLRKGYNAMWESMICNYTFTVLFIIISVQCVTVFTMLFAMNLLF